MLPHIVKIIVIIWYYTRFHKNRENIKMGEKDEKVVYYFGWIRLIGIQLI